MSELKSCPMSGFYDCIKNTCGWYSDIADKCSLVVLADQLHGISLEKLAEGRGEGE